MKCTSTIICALAAVASTDAWKQIATNDGVRLLSSASMVKQNDGGIMTMAADTRPSVSNGGVNFYPYTSDIRNYIVQAHNTARATLTPTQAANMRQVAWDESLAIEAAELVNTCVFEHDTENYAYGQNLMYGGRTIDTKTVDGWMDAWVKNEISGADRVSNGYMDLDHASAVLWATTYLVGCASKMCPNGYLTACNYYTPGNWQGERTYVPGTPCSQCPTQAPYCDATGKLCTATRVSTPTSAPAPVPQPQPTPAKTTSAPSPGQSVPAPTPASTTPSPLPTPAKTQSQADQQETKTPSPVVQRPVDETPAPAVDDETTTTPEPTEDTGKWTNVEDSPAAKPVVSTLLASVCGLLLIARAM